MTANRFDPAKVAKLAKGEVAVEHTMNHEDLPMLRALFKKATPKEEQTPEGTERFYWVLSGTYRCDCRTPLPPLPLHSFLREEGIEGWELVRKKYVVAAKEIVPPFTWQPHLSWIVTDKEAIQKLREAGVLELWFKPIYKEREEPKKQNDVVKVLGEAIAKLNAIKESLR